jgi:stage V sporulation protein B
MSDAKKLFNNTLLLTATSFLMRTVSVSFNAYLTGIIGADGIGLFQLIISVYTMAVTFASGGIRLASMRLVADNTTTRKFSERQIMRLCILYSLICGTVIAVLLFGFSDIIGRKWICDSKSIPSLRVLSLSLPFVAVSASFGGYFTAIRKIVRYTLVQFCEQIFRIAVTVFSLKLVASRGIEAACIAIVFGMTSAEIFSMCSSAILYALSCNKDGIPDRFRSVVKRLLRISIPDAVGAEMRSILMTVEHLLIPSGFRKSGNNPQTAMATYGVIHGMSLPLVLYPSALLSSLSGLLVPEFSAQHTKGNKTRISYMIARVLHLSLIFSVGTAGILYFNSHELSMVVYNNDDVSFYTQVFAPLVPVMYMDMTIDGMLKGLDQQVSYMRYNIIDASICVILVYFLVPVSGVKGYVFVVFLSEILNFALSFRRLTVVSEVRVDLFKSIVIPALCIVSAGSVKSIIAPFFLTGSRFSDAVFCVVLCLCVYLALLKAFGSIEKEEILWAKGLSKAKMKKTASPQR